MLYEVITDLDFLGRYHLQISVLGEGRDKALLGWATKNCKSSTRDWCTPRRPALAAAVLMAGGPPTTSVITSYSIHYTKLYDSPLIHGSL